MEIASYYDSVECPHGLEGYASGFDRDTLAGHLTLDRESPVTMIQAAASYGYYTPVVELIVGGEHYECDSYDDYVEDLIRIVHDPDVHHPELRHSGKCEGEYSVGGIPDLNYGGGYTRGAANEGDGPSFDPDPKDFYNGGKGVEVQFDITFSGVLPAGNDIVPSDVPQDFVFRFQGSYESGGSISMSRESAELFNTLDRTLYAVISDEGYNGPFVGDEAEAEAEAAFDTAVREGHENVALVLVDRSGDPYETLKEWNADDARTPNPRHYGPRRPRR